MLRADRRTGRNDEAKITFCNFANASKNSELRGYLLHGAESFLRSQLVLQLVKKFPAFLEPEGSSPYSQVPATLLHGTSSRNTPPPPGYPSGGVIYLRIVLSPEEASRFANIN